MCDQLLQSLFSSHQADLSVPPSQQYAQLEVQECSDAANSEGPWQKNCTRAVFLNSTKEALQELAPNCDSNVTSEMLAEIEERVFKSALSRQEYLRSLSYKLHHLAFLISTDDQPRHEVVYRPKECKRTHSPDSDVGELDGINVANVLKMKRRVRQKKRRSLLMKSGDCTFCGQNGDLNFDEEMDVWLCISCRGHQSCDDYSSSDSEIDYSSDACDVDDQGSNSDNSEYMSVE